MAVIGYAVEGGLDEMIKRAMLRPITKATVIVLTPGSAPIAITTPLNHTLKPEEIPLLENRIGFLYFYVVGSFEDSLTRTRVEFEHCWQYKFDDPTNIPFCTTHNSVKETRY